MTEKQAKHWAGLTDEQVKLELRQYHKDIQDMTGGRACVACAKANSLHHAWEELERRGFKVTMGHVDGISVEG